MTDSPEIIEAARALGHALNAHPAVQAFLRASEAVQRDETLTRQEQELQERYDALMDRQSKGEYLFPQEVNEFYKMRDALLHDPLINQREATLKAMQQVFQGAGASLSSMLTVDFTRLVK